MTITSSASSQVENHHRRCPDIRGHCPHRHYSKASKIGVNLEISLLSLKRRQEWRIPNKNTHCWSDALESADDVSTLRTEELPLLEGFTRGSITITAADPVAFAAVIFADALDEFAARVLLAATGASCRKMLFK